MFQTLCTLVRRGFLVVALAAPVACETIPASAEDAVLWRKVGSWGIYTGANACVTAAEYHSGYTLGFGLSPSAEFIVFLSNPTWSIPSGNYSVTIKIDRTQASTVTVEAFDGDSLKIPLVLNEHNLNLLKYGRTMHVLIGRQVASFNLVNTQHMLPELGRCAGALMNGARTAGYRNPFQ